ncbi:MAG: hypothetical protein ABEJ56_03305 [Candidatus Nanohaloarchaea archaeon]
MPELQDDREVSESEEPDFSFPFESNSDKEESVACPECGMEFKNNRGKNIHVGQAHQ